MNAPLSKERRASIHRLLDPEGNYHSLARHVAENVVTDLLAAEQYWREAVKNAEMGSEDIEYGGDGVTVCPFCGGRGGYAVNYEVQHKRDCPWRQAQEG